MQFNETLRQLREDTEPRLSQARLAALLGTTQRKISRLETGEAEPSLQDIHSLCMHYNVSADYLLGLPKGLPYPKR